MLFHPAIPIGVLLVTLVMNFMENTWQSALLLIGIFLVALLLHHAVAFVVFLVFGNIERHLIKRSASVEEGAAGVSEKLLYRFDAIAFAVFDSAYAYLVFSHFHGLAHDSIAFFFVACAAFRYFSFLATRSNPVTRLPPTSFIIALAIYGIGYLAATQQGAQNPPPLSWQNPISHQAATPLPGSWHLIPPPNDAPPNIWEFADSTNEEVVIIRFEHADVGLQAYVYAVQESIPMLGWIRNGTTTSDGTREVWTGDGVGTPAGTTTACVVRAHAFGGDGGFWWVVEIVPEGRSADAAAQEPQVFRAVMKTTTPTREYARPHPG